MDCCSLRWRTAGAATQAWESACHAQVTSKGGGESDFHAHLYVDLVSKGADVHDIRVQMECFDVNWVRRHRARWLPRLPMRVRHDFPFTPATHGFGAIPTSEHPNPLKNGQVARFIMTDHFLRSVAAAHPYFRLPSEYWPSRVRIAIYYSGGRLLKTRSAWRFRRTLAAFDHGSLQAVGRRPTPEVAHAPPEGIELNIEDIEFVYPELNMPRPRAVREPKTRAPTEDG